MSTPVPEPYLLRLDETGTPSYVGRGDSLSRPSTLSCESIGVGTSISSILNSYPEPCRIPSSYPRRACPVLDTGETFAQPSFPRRRESRGGVGRTRASVNAGPQAMPPHIVIPAKSLPRTRYGAGIQSQRRGSQSTLKQWAGPIFRGVTDHEGCYAKLSRSGHPGVGWGVVSSSLNSTGSKMPLRSLPSWSTIPALQQFRSWEAPSWR